MTPERWESVSEILEKAISMSEAERERYVDSACGADHELRTEVLSLLMSHQQAGSQFLNSPIAAPAPEPSRVGRRIGPYLVQELIAHGGMGEVFAAVRADGQYEKRVAIKLVRSGFDSGLIVDRFRTERQILASLVHPNIAQLLDGGTTEDGIPYLVLEFVEGLPIDEHCESRKLPIEERLQLFREVCSAVQYAHQRLVIHRDLKPGNILVTTDGIAKLLDFGIAKLLSPSASTEATLIGAMTPEYASPEQVSGEPITTATDIYSLGVVLYRLLTGRSPYRVKTGSSSELARAIVEAVPERPSTAARLHAANESASSGTRRVNCRRLSGDLDNIVLKALRKEPARRYLSVEQFSEDIRRHLMSLPVIAVPDSFSYRAKKFVQRHRMSVAAALLAFGAIVSASAISVRQAQIARQQKQRAEKRFNDVRRLADSLVFEIHDSIASLPGATPARKLLLDRAVQYLDNLSQDTAGDVDLQRELAWGYQRLSTVQGDTTQSNLGEVSAAETSQKKAMALFEAVAKANPANVQDQLNLAMAYRTRAFYDIYVPSGRSEITRALAVGEPLLKAYPDDVRVQDELAQEYFILGDILDAAGDRTGSIETYEKVVALRRSISQQKPDYPGIRQAVAKATVLLANEMGRFGSREKALQLMRTGIAEFEALAATKDPGLIREWLAAEGRLGEIELMNGDITSALSHFQHSRSQFERLAKLDPENKMLQSDLWVAKFVEARALAVSGHYAKALPLLQAAYNGYMGLHLDYDVGPGRGAMQAWIAEAQSATGDLADAAISYQNAAKSLAEDLGSYDDARCDLAMVQAKLGSVLTRSGKFHEANEEFSKALATADLQTSVQRMDLPAIYAAAEIYASLGDLGVAEGRATPRSQDKLRLISQARANYDVSLRTRRLIPTPSRYSPNGYLVRDLGELNRQLAAFTRPTPVQPGPN